MRRSLRNTEALSHNGVIARQQTQMRSSTPASTSRIQSFMVVGLGHCPRITFFFGLCRSMYRSPTRGQVPGPRVGQMAALRWRFAPSRHISSTRDQGLVVPGISPRSLQRYRLQSPVLRHYCEQTHARLIAFESMNYLSVSHILVKQGQCFLRRVSGPQRGGCAMMSNWTSNIGVIRQRHSKALEGGLLAALLSLVLTGACRKLQICKQGLVTSFQVHILHLREDPCRYRS